MASGRVDNKDLLQPLLDIKEDVGKLFGGQMEVKNDIKELKENTQAISVEMPELLRKVSEHHTMYHALKDADCPNMKVMPEPRPKDGNGGYRERRTKKPYKQQFVEMPLGKKISSIVIIVTFFGAFGEWILAKAHNIIDLLESIFI